MQRERGELVPFDEVIADLPGPVQALHPSTPPGSAAFACRKSSEGSPPG